MNEANGVLIIKDVPDTACKEKVRELLLRSVRNCDKDKIDSLLDRPPVTLGGRIPKDTGIKLAQSLSKLGANTVFIEKRFSSIGPQRKVSPKHAGRASIDSAGHKELVSKEIERPLGEKSNRGAPTIQEKASSGNIHHELSLKEVADAEANIFLDHSLHKHRPLRYRIADQVAEVNKELWIILTMVAVAGLMNYLVTSQYMILGLYSFPTIMSAYFYGRRHAVMTAVLTIIIVGVMVQFNDVIFTGGGKMQIATGKWYHMMAWGSVLICTAYAMGTLYERHMEKVKELRKTYQGLIVILRHFISKDQYTENHCYRVSVYASKIAAYLGLDDDAIEDIRSAALLHDIGKLKVSRELLYKAARLSDDEYKQIQKHVSNGAEILEPIKGPLGRIIPIILAHHDKYDGNGYHPNKGDAIPLGARILAVADVYDALTSDRPYRKAMAPIEAKEIIVKGASKDFDPRVVKAFLMAFERGEMDVPTFVV